MDTNLTLRIGVLQFPGVLVVGNDGATDGRCSLQGTTADIWQMAFDKVITAGYRCTMTIGNHLGRYDASTQSYDGLIGMLQRDEIDWINLPVYYPLNESSDVFTYSHILVEDTMTTLSYYNISRKRHEGNVLSMFASVPYQLWIGYILSFMIFVSVICLGSHILKSKFSCLWNAICAFLDQDNFPTNSMFITTLSTVVSVCMFFLISYLTNSMKTEMVTVEDASVIGSYDDMIEKDVYNNMFMQLPEWEKFENAKIGSKEWKIFQKTSAFGGRGKVVQPKDGDRNTEFFTQQRALVGRPIIVYFNAYLVIMDPKTPFNRNDGRMLISVDDEAKKFSNVMVSNSKWNGSPFQRIMFTYFQRQSEHGLQIRWMDNFPVIAIEFFIQFRGGSSGDAEKPSTQLLITTSVETADGDVISIGFVHFKPVLTSVLIPGFLTGLIVLVVEVIKYDLKYRVKRHPFGARKYRKDVRLMKIKKMQHCK